MSGPNGRTGAPAASHAEEVPQPEVGQNKLKLSMAEKNVQVIQVTPRHATPTPVVSANHI